MSEVVPERLLRLPLILRHRFSVRRPLGFWQGECAFCPARRVDRDRLEAMRLLKQHVRVSHPRLYRIYEEGV